MNQKAKEEPRHSFPYKVYKCLYFRGRFKIETIKYSKRVLARWPSLGCKQELQNKLQNGVKKENNEP